MYRKGRNKMKTTVKYTIRRLVVAIPLAAVLVSAYWLFYVLLVAFGAIGNYETFESNSWTLGITFIIAVTFYPQINNVVKKVLGE